jgi:hypothetical protein
LDTVPVDISPYFMRYCIGTQEQGFERRQGNVPICLIGEAAANTACIT